MLWEVLGLLLLAVVIYRLVFRFKLTHLPSVPGKPFIGCVSPDLKDRAHMVFSEWSKTLGLVFRVQIFRQEMAVASTAESIREVLVTNGDAFTGRPYVFRFAYALEGPANIVFMSACDKWQWMRKFMHRSLKQYSSGIKEIEDITMDIADDFVEELKGLKGDPVDPIRPLHGTMIQILMVMVFGEKLEKSHADFATLLKIDKSLELMAPTGKGSELDTFPWLRFFNNDAFNQLKHMVQIRHEQYKTWRDKALKSINSGEDQNGIIYKLYQTIARSNEANLSETNLKMLISDIMVAGSSTSISSLSSLLLILVHHPELQERLREEVISVVGSDERVSIAHREKMPLLRATILEMLRYVTIVPIVAHTAIKDTTLGGFAIPKDSGIFVNLWAMHHDPDTYPDSYTFRPERFLDEAGALVPADHPSRKHMIPFGAGPRVCVGEMLALTRIFLLSATLLRHFRFLPAGELKDQTSCDPRTFVVGLVLRPREYKMRFQAID